MTLDEANLNLAAARDAYRNALDAQSSRFGDKSISRHSIELLRHEYEYWTRVVNDLTLQSARTTPAPKASIATWSSGIAPSLGDRWTR